MNLLRILSKTQLNHFVHLAQGLSYRDDYKYGPMYFGPTNLAVQYWDSSPRNYVGDDNFIFALMESEKISCSSEDKQYSAAFEEKCAEQQYCQQAPTRNMAVIYCYLSRVFSETLRFSVDNFEETHTVLVSQLSEAELDWAVGKCAGRFQLQENDKSSQGNEVWAPSINWHQAGPIMQSENIEYTWTGKRYSASVVGLVDGQVRPLHYPRGFWVGQTALIASMRCYVASKMGEEIEVPVNLGKNI